MRKVLLILLVSTSQLFAQSPADDEVVFNSAVDWLNSKLDYLYYDEYNENWWNNTFYMNENKEVTIKQISSKTPQTANIKNKNYTIRQFKIEDINPYNIQIKEVDESMGRFVKGKLLEIRTFSEQRKIHKTINNRRATSTSFLHLSFPKILTDTLVNYPELVKSKLYDAVISATKVYSSGNTSDKETILKVMEGKFQADSSGDQLVAEKVFDNVLQIEVANAISYFGYDSGKGQFFLNTISAAGVKTDYYRLKDDNQIILESISDPENTILFDTLNSFRLNGNWYFRQ